MSRKSIVVVVPINSYDEELVYQAVSSGVNTLGGIQTFVKPDDNILVKPNFLLSADVEKGVSTHPNVIRAVLRLLSENGFTHVQYGDSPGHGSCRAAAERLGLTSENTFGATVADMSEEKVVSFPEGMECREFHFTKEIAEADAIINVCKMKTHMLERITGAVKNVYGFVCGHRKALGHVKFPNDTIFARMLADIHRCRTPKLNIMDGIVAMDGNGPSSGTLTNMNVILISTDPVALDTVFCYLVDLDPELVPTCSQGRKLGIGTDLEEEIEIKLLPLTADEAKPALPGSLKAGSPSDASQPGTAPKTISKDELFRLYGNPHFDVSRNAPPRSSLSLLSKITTRLARRPYIDKKLCVKCGICTEHCPVPGKAVSFANGKSEPPVYDYKKCIRCYCCQEMCPKHAIKVRGLRTK